MLDLKLFNLSSVSSAIFTIFGFAEVVKLANTLRSGRSERKLLRVQLPSSAHKAVVRIPHTVFRRKIKKINSLKTVYEIRDTVYRILKRKEINLGTI